MTTLITVLAIVFFILIYKNIDWIKYMWKEYVFSIETFPSDYPPFCFDCNLGSCKGCLAYNAYQINPAEGWKIFNTGKYC